MRLCHHRWGEGHVTQCAAFILVHVTLIAALKEKYKKRVKILNGWCISPSIDLSLFSFQKLLPVTSTTSEPLKGHPSSHDANEVDVVSRRFLQAWASICTCCIKTPLRLEDTWSRVQWERVVSVLTKIQEEKVTWVNRNPDLYLNTFYCMWWHEAVFMSYQFNWVTLKW